MIVEDGVFTGTADIHSIRAKCEGKETPSFPVFMSLDL